MEGIHALPHGPAQKAAKPAVPASAWWLRYLPSVVVAAFSYAVHYVPFPPFRVMSASGARYPVSAAIIAIVLGVLVRNLLPIPAAAVESAKGLARRVIPATIVLAGAGLNLVRVASVGPMALAITMICMTIALVSTLWLGKIFGVWHKTAMLIGAGTAICGTSAIVAVGPLIEAEDSDLMLSIGTVNILGLVLMFVLPALGGVMHLRDEVFGVWAGTTIHAVPQVVAAGFAYSAPAGTLATLVKLVRVTLLAPFLFVLGFVQARKRGKSVAIPYSRLVPPFVYGFLALSLANTFALLPVLQFRFGTYPLAGLLADCGELLLTLSMAAMGLEVNIRFLAKTGAGAVLTGTAATAVLCAASLLLIRLLL